MHVYTSLRRRRRRRRWAQRCVTDVDYSILTSSFTYLDHGAIVCKLFLLCGLIVILRKKYLYFFYLLTIDLHIYTLPTIKACCLLEYGSFLTMKTVFPVVLPSFFANQTTRFGARNHPLRQAGAGNLHSNRFGGRGAHLLLPQRRRWCRFIRACNPSSDASLLLLQWMLVRWCLDNKLCPVDSRTVSTSARWCTDRTWKISRIVRQYYCLG